MTVEEQLAAASAQLGNMAEFYALSLPGCAAFAKSIAAEVEDAFQVAVSASRTPVPNPDCELERLWLSECEEGSEV